MFMKFVWILILIFICFKGEVNAEGNWRMHPNFLDEITHIIPTNDFVYFTSRKLPDNEVTYPYLSLFRYDKTGNELISLSTDNALSDNGVRDVIYNPGKRYLFVLNQNYDIDILKDDGSSERLPYYRLDNSGLSKNVNGISIDDGKNRVYLATDFGYVAIDDNKMEIAESRNYGHPLQSFARLGDKYIAISQDQLVFTSIKNHNSSLDDFQNAAFEWTPMSLHSLGENLCFLIYTKDSNQYLGKIINDEAGLSFQEIRKIEPRNIDYTKNGLNIKSGTNLIQINTNGEISEISLPEDFSSGSAVAENTNEIWHVQKYFGLRKLKRSGNEWTGGGFIRPDSPSVYVATDFVNHPENGLLTIGYGFTPVTHSLYQMTPVQINGYKNGRWENFSPTLTNPSRGEIMYMTNGLAIDPDDNSYIYVSSPHHGFMRFNLDNPKDIQHFSRNNDKGSTKAGFVAIVPTSTYLPTFANFSAPRFDAKGNLWMNYADWDSKDNPTPHFYCWTSTDRRAFIAGDNSALPKRLDIKSAVPVSNSPLLQPLTKTGNGLLVFSDYQYNEILLLIDTNGTPLDQEDDTVYSFTTFTDTDGNNVDVSQIKFIWEEPSTGYVWVGHRNGIFYFIPDEIRTNDSLIHRIKVSRNDGTNLADYLLDDVTVNSMTEDSTGRKWFATNGGGVVCTTSDGREIIKEFTISNSELPDDIVYGIAYNKDANSIIISTAKGMAEYFLPKSDYNNKKNDIKAYPNPVRPEFSGYVTINDIADGSLVKIVDAAGNLVKELGIVSGFEILWDISDMNFRRVQSGVYYIMASPTQSGGTYSKVGKILVVS